MLKNKDYLDKELLLRVKTIMLIRVVFLTGFVALVIAFERNASQETPIIPLSIVVGVAYFLSLSYALLLRWKVHIPAICWAQVFGDLLVVGGMIYATGGIESPLSFVFLFVIVATSVMLPRAAVYLAASGASIIYGLIVDLEYFNVIQPIYFFQKSNISYQGAYGFYIIAMNLASYYSVAYLSSILTHRMRLIKEELRTKSLDLKKLQEFHKNVVQNLVNGLITTDLEGNITSMNTACQIITGYSAQTSMGRKIFQLIDMPKLNEFYEKRSEVELPTTLEGEFKRSDGESILVMIKISALIQPDDNIPLGVMRPDGFIFVFEDLTEMRKMEEKILQSEQLAAVGRFSAGLAHEIRNPLASLSGSIQVLKESLKLDDQYQRLMDIVLKETERLNTIVSEFLAYSQPRDTKTTVIDFTQMLQDIVLLLKNSNDYDSSIDVQIHAPDKHILIQSEEDLVKQMVWNLCINAMQAMDKAGKICLELQEVESYHHANFHTDSKGILLIVEDQGRGIPEENLQKLFDPFFTTREEGVGLGLATVVKIVQKFGGNIALYSEPAKGTRFEIYMPQERTLLGSRQPTVPEKPKTLTTT